MIGRTNPILMPSRNRRRERTRGNAAAVPTTTLGAHTWVTVPLQVAFPTAPGDHPETVQFVAANGAKSQLAIARRTLIPSTGGEFDTQITASVGRGTGQVTTFNISVPAGRPDLKSILSPPHKPLRPGGYVPSE